MSDQKFQFPDLGEANAREQREARQLALEYLAEAWNMAEDEGIESIALAHASLCAALATLVRTHGEETTARLVDALPARIREGEYTLERLTH